MATIRDEIYNTLYLIAEAKKETRLNEQTIVRVIEIQLELARGRTETPETELPEGIALPNPENIEDPEPGASDEGIIEDIEVVTETEEDTNAA